jgi:hypothetical protein
MNNVVSFETARALKAAGFPQPMPEARQFWYYGDRNGLVLTTSEAMDGEAYFYWFDVGGVSMLEDGQWSEKMIYAPTATDILRELPDYALFFNGGMATVALMGAWGEHNACDASEHEAGAAAWLSVHAKPEQIG